MKLFFTLLVFFCFVNSSAVLAENIPYQSGKLPYLIKLNNEVTRYNQMSFFFLPNEKINLSILKQDVQQSFRVLDESVESEPNGLEQAAPKQASFTVKFVFTTPAQAGVQQYRVELSNGEVLSFAVFTLRPFSDVKKGKLGAYVIGEYPKTPLNNLDIYKPPPGFVEVPKELVNFKVSPHYTLGQFLCKQPSGYPKYLVLRTPLLAKLEYLTDRANEAGYYTQGFTVMSAYRTPHYNALIKNKKYSRHQWGGAADIYLDEKPKNNVMDDLNKDGKINIQDAKALAELVEKSFTLESYLPFVGGLGLYEANAAHGPFIHVDVRGSKARW